MKKCVVCDQPVKKGFCTICFAKQPPKVKEPRAPKAEKSEADLVRQYANVIISKQRTRGMVGEKHANLKKEGTINKNLWQDTDFYFSVVFQSAAQKYEFLEHVRKTFGVGLDREFGGTIQIVNGLRLAEGMGCALKKEVASEFPCGNIELRDFVLDDDDLTS